MGLGIGSTKLVQIRGIVGNVDFLILSMSIFLCVNRFKNLEKNEVKKREKKMDKKDILQGLAETNCYQCKHCGKSGLSRDEVSRTMDFIKEKYKGEETYICDRCLDELRMAGEHEDA